MKTIKGLLWVFLVILFMTKSSYAFIMNKDLGLVATIEAATGLNFLTFSVTNSSGSDVLSPAGSTLSFGDLIYSAVTDPLTHVVSTSWRSDHAFAIEIAPVGGTASTMNINVQYSELTNPNSTTNGHGLGWKSTVTFMNIINNVESPITAHGGTGKMLLKDLPESGEAVTSAQIIAGSLRMYIGMVAKDPSAAIPDPVDGEVFTNFDQPGEYTGKLTISATGF